MASPYAFTIGDEVFFQPHPGAQLELVQHGVTGLVAETTEQYAQAVGWLLANPAEARRMGQAGRDKAQQLFRAQDIAAKLGGMYLDLLARKAARKGRGVA